MLNDICRIDEVVLQNAKFTKFHPTSPNILALLATANKKCNTKPTLCNSSYKMVYSEIYRTVTEYV